MESGVYGLPEECIRNKADREKWNAMPKAYTWNDLTDAWEKNFAAIKRYQLMEFRGQELQVGLDISATADLRRILTSPVFSEISDVDIKNFERSLDKAREVLHLYYDFVMNNTRHDSSVEGVMKSLPKFKFIHAPEIRRIVQDTIDIVKNWYVAVFCYYEYVVFLTTLKHIKRSTPQSDAMAMLKNDPVFKESAFKDLPESELYRGLDVYLHYLHVFKRKKARSKCIRSVNRHLKFFRKHYRKRALRRLPVGYRCAAHFLAYLERCKKYTIRESFAEITKLRVYFSTYVKGVPPPFP